MFKHSVIKGAISNMAVRRSLHLKPSPVNCALVELIHQHAISTGCIVTFASDKLAIFPPAF